MRLTFILASLAALSSISHAASFDCSKSPEKPAERMICQSDSLSTLDGQLAVAFKAAIKGAGADASVNDVLKSSQQRWLRYTRDACKNVQCMEKAYVSRIAFLLQWNEDAPADNKADGNYHYSHNMDFANGTHAVVEDCLNIKSAGNGQAQSIPYWSSRMDIIAVSMASLQLLAIPIPICQARVKTRSRTARSN